MIVCKYKFDKSIYSNLIPVFNDGYTGYTINDEIDSENSNYVIRTIECDILPTLMRFGRVWVEGESSTNNRTDSLLKILDMNTSELTSCHSMFRYNKNLTNISCNWDTSNVINMYDMFTNCKSLISLNVSNWDTSKVTIMGWIFGGCQKLTSLNVSNWETSKVTNMNNMFDGCNNLTELDVSNFDTKNVASMYDMFQGCSNLTSLDVSNFDTSKVNNMGYMFANCNNLTSLDVGSFDTSKVTNMQYMFYGCNKLTTLDVSNFDTSNVTDMSAMFWNCNKLTSLDVSNFDTSEVTTMYDMFSGCASLTSIDVSNFDTSKVTNIAYMFNGCSTLQTVGDLTNWNTKNLELCYALFYRCFKLKYAHIGGWNTSKVRNVRSMFAGCESIETIDMHNFDFKNAYNDTGELFKYDMFQLKYLRINDLLGNDYAIDMIPSRTGKEQGVLISDVEISEETLVALASKNWTVVTSDTLTKVAEYVYDSKIWNSMIPIFNDEFVEYFIDDVEDENGLVTRTISSVEGNLPTRFIFGKPWNVDNSNIADARNRCLLEVLYLNITNRITSMLDMFKLCEKLKYVNCDNWDTSNVTYTGNMFFLCYSLASLDVSNLDTSNVVNMEYMFSSCANLTSLDLSNWDTGKVTSMGWMFGGCNNLTSLNVSNFNTSNATSMAGMFQGCKSLTSLDVSNWDTSNVIYMSNMFNGCHNLNSLDVSNWDTSNVTNMRSMFDNTYKLSNIGMLYCSPSTINTITSALPTTHTQTIWVKDTDINKLTSVSGVEFKEYKENSYMINLSSPLLDGDRIEVVDGKLCHYHKMGKVVLGYHDSWTYGRPSSGWNQNGDAKAYYLMDKHNVVPNKKINGYCYTEKFKTFKESWIVTNTFNENCMSMGHINYIIIRTTDKSVGEDNNGGFKQWLQANPITVIYELAEPYYEDITPLQSDIVLETYLECNMDICTDLPIKTNVSYITNVPSLSTLSMRATEMKESDNIIANLTNMLDNEINE